MKDDKTKSAAGKGACDHKSVATHKEYSITIKPTTTENKKLTVENDLFLLEFYVTLCTKHNMVRLCSVKELDSKGIPHIHGTILCSKMPFLRVKGWSIRIDEKYSSYWDDYLLKQFKKIRIEIDKDIKHYTTTYSFIDNHHKSPYYLSLI